MNKKRTGFCIEIFTRPQAKQRPRFYKGHTYTPKKTKDYEEFIRSEFLKRYGIKKIKGSIFVDIVFRFHIPKNQKKQIEKNEGYTKRPDLDNLVKAVLDGLNNVAWEDDSQITELRSRKIYDDYDSIEIHIIEK